MILLHCRLQLTRQEEGGWGKKNGKNTKLSVEESECVCVCLFVIVGDSVWDDYRLAGRGEVC